MYWSIILLKYSIADGVVNALHDREDKILQQHKVYPYIHRFHNKGTESPSIFPPKTAPGHHRNTFALFFGAMHSVFHFSDDLNTQTWYASSDFSNEHSSLQITPSNSSAVQFSRSLAHFRRLAACSGVNFGRRFAIHFIIPFFRRYRSIVARDTSGAHSSRSCSWVNFRLRLIVHQICRRSCLVSFSGLPDLGRFSI